MKRLIKNNLEVIQLIRKFFFHAQVWLIVFLVGYFLFRNDRFQINLSDKIWTWVVYVLTFYINYLFLFRYFFYRKKYLVYTLSVIFVLVVSSWIIGSIREKYFMERRRFDPPIENDIYHKPPRDTKDFNFSIDSKPPHPPVPIKMHLPNLLNILLIYTASSSLRFYEKWQENEQLQIEKEKEKIQTELLFLKQQINPHFLFNSLNNIYSLALTKSDLTTVAILKLSSILRYILYKSKERLVLLTDELGIIQDYIDLQSLRINNNVELHYKTEGDAGIFKIEPFILLPIIENCFKYGVDNIKESFIDIAIYLQENKLTLMTKNTLFKRLQKNEKESSGIGIGNIIRRLELLYPGKYTFSNEEKDDHYHVILTIILNE